MLDYMRHALGEGKFVRASRDFLLAKSITPGPPLCSNTF
jgi:hypothetical protein